jgi:uncharacterized protein (DUF488 family)
MLPTVWTIGHSTRSLDEFTSLLSAHGIQAVADVRRYPGSRRWPHFERTALGAALKACGLDYLWLAALGGRRVPRPDSVNTAWRSASFRGYADYMETEEFAESLMTLQSLALGARTAIMCAEALWWRCHRALISDALQWMGFRVLHIMSATSVVSHPYTAAADVSGDKLSYHGTA